MRLCNDFKGNGALFVTLYNATTRLWLASVELSSQLCSPRNLEELDHLLSSNNHKDQALPIAPFVLFRATSSSVTSIMESKPPQNPPKKQKFKPRAPPRPIPKAEVKTEKVDDVDATRATELMRQFQERSMKGRVKDEKKVHASQIAFGMGAASISLKSYGAPRGGSSINRAGGPSSSDGAYPPVLRENEYQEPWDYYSNYPVTLPLRRPYSGDPAILDEQEFGEAAENAVYDENATSPAAELGLLEENVEPTMFFLQLPSIMPMIKRSANADSQDDKENSKPKATSGIGKSCRVDDLPAGYMGKMLVYKSGAVKLKLGDTLYDVSPGMGCIFAQDVVAMNTAEKRCCVVGEIEKRAVVTPDVKELIASIPNFNR